MCHNIYYIKNVEMKILLGSYASFFLFFIICNISISYAVSRNKNNQNYLKSQDYLDNFSAISTESNLISDKNSSTSEDELSLKIEQLLDKYNMNNKKKKIRKKKRIEYDYVVSRNYQQFFDDDGNKFIIIDDKCYLI